MTWRSFLTFFIFQIEPPKYSSLVCRALTYLHCIYALKLHALLTKGRRRVSISTQYVSKLHFAFTGTVQLQLQKQFPTKSMPASLASSKIIKDDDDDDDEMILL